MFRDLTPMPLLAATMTRNLRASRQVLSAWRALGASLFLAVAVPAAVEAQLPVPPDTVSMVNRGSRTYSAPDGTVSRDSAFATVIVRQLAGLTLAPSRAQAAPPAIGLALAHVLTNTGTVNDAFALS